MAENSAINPDTLTYRSWQSQGSTTWHVKENWTWHEALEWTLQVKESLGFSERLSNVVSFVRSYSERLGLTSKGMREPSKKFSSAFSISETDGCLNSFVRDYEESLSFKERPQRLTIKRLVDKFSLKDAYKHAFGLYQYRTLKIAEELSRAIGFQRRYTEALSFTENCKHLYGLEKAEQITFYDTLVRNAQGVLSDIFFEQGEWNIDELQKYMLKGKHVGYEHFKPFIYGDYTYEKALFRTALDAAGADRALLEQFQIAVDVPDITDRGSAEVTDKNFNLDVKFNKKFHIAPEVTVTMRSGTSDKPVVATIVSIDETHFELFLQNALTGERTTGRFIWTAVGY